MDLKETNILGDAIGDHWYYQSKSKAMTQLTTNLEISKVLDVGAGSGYFSRCLLEQTSATEAVCIDPNYETDSDDLVDNKALFFRRSIDKSDADLVLFMDVLEHVDDDVGLLKEYIKKVKSGTYFLVTVPAFQSLWSSHDVFLEHRRRYRLAEIENTARASGLEILHGNYYFGLLFPIVMIMRKLEKLNSKKEEDMKSQLRLHNPFVNSALSKICDAELNFFKYNRFAGLSAFLLAKKK